MFKKIIRSEQKIRCSKINSYILIPLFLSCLNLTSVYAAEKQAIGWIEHVSINGNELQLEAKIDTGATTSSVDAEIIKKFKRDGEKWIRFSIKNKDGLEIVLERKILRSSKIKRKLTFSQKRPVIKLGVCLANVYRELEVNLADRTNFNYQVLVGRNFLRGHFLVDSEIKFKTNPACKVEAK